MRSGSSAGAASSHASNAGAASSHASSAEPASSHAVLGGAASSAGAASSHASSAGAASSHASSAGAASSHASSAGAVSSHASHASSAEPASSHAAPSGGASSVGAASHSASVPASSAGATGAPPDRSGAVVAPAPSVISAPVSMQPSGPVPRPETVASGSGPHDPSDAPRFAIPADAAGALAMWNQVLAELEALGKVSLFMPFQHARVLKWSAELLELGFPDEFHSMGDMARDSTDELRAILRGLAPGFKAIKVAVRLLDPGESKTAGARSVLEDSRDRTSAERNRRETEAREHPITKHVLQTFGAQIKEIKTDV
jgi:hypothetical protein